MDKKTINSIIDTFDESYAKNSNALYNKYKSVDKFVELSHDYVLGLQVDSFEKEIFLSYFDSHLRSIYRRDFEKDKVEMDLEKNDLAKGHHTLLYLSWAGIFGGMSAFLGTALSDSIVVILASSFAGIAGGAYFAQKGIHYGKNPESIPGTNEYEKQLRKKLYETFKNI